MFKLNTKQIANCLNAQIENCAEALPETISSVVSNHNAVKRNGVFVAIKGKNFDGHDFSKQAVENGACLVIVEKRQPDLPQIVVENTRMALLQLANLNRQQFKGPVVAVTGSFGKTTTKDMIATAINSNHNVLKTQNNLNNEIGVAQTLLELNSNHTVAVVELGMSHANEISVLSKAVNPTVGIITGIGRAHFENFKSLDEILKAKLEILHGMNKNSFVIYNSDDERLNQSVFKNYNTISCSMKNKDADFFANNLVQTENSIKFDAVFEKNQLALEIPVLCSFNALNALFAVATGKLLNVTYETIAKNLKNFSPTGLRQKTFSSNSVKIIADCYNASPETVKTALIEFDRISCTGKKIAVLGDMLELGVLAKKSHKEIGNLLNTLNIDEIVCFGKLAKNIAKSTKKNANHFNDTKKLVDFVKSKLEPNSLILFKASRALNFEKLIEQIFPDLNYNQKPLNTI